MDRHNEHLKKYLQSHKNGTKRFTSKTETPDKTDACTCTQQHYDHADTSANKSTPKPLHKVKDARQTPKSKRSTASKTTEYAAKKATLQTLPGELLLKIFEYFGPGDLLTAARVCKRWLHLTDDNVLWQKIFIRHMKTIDQSKYAHGVKKKEKAAKADATISTNWKTKCIQRCCETRNNRALGLLKKQKLFHGLPKQQDTDNAIRKLGTKWMLYLTDSDNNEHPFYHSDVFSFQMSTCVRWFTLEFPSIKSLKKLKVYAVNPVFFDQKLQPVPNSACQRSLMLECPVNSQQIGKINTVASDDTIDVKLLLNGILIGIFKSDGEIAFVTACFHAHKLVERCLFGSSTRPYIPPLTRPPMDDIDSQRGLHGYMCCMELRNKRNSAWSQIFRDVYCKLDYVKENKGNRMARFELIKEDCSFSHSPIGRKLTFPWKTDLFKGIIKDFSILDLTLTDEQNTPMWTVSSPVRLVDPHTTDVTYDYDGNAFDVTYEDDGIGEVHMTMIWEPEIEQYMIKQLNLFLSFDYINHWFRTSY